MGTYGSAMPNGWWVTAEAPIVGSPGSLPGSAEGSRIVARGDGLAVLRAQRQTPASGLEHIAACPGERNAAIVVAYATGAKSYREIAAYFGDGSVTGERMVRSAMQQCENCPRLLLEFCNRSNGALSLGR